MDVNSEGTNRGDKPRDVLSDGACSALLSSPQIGPGPEMPRRTDTDRRGPGPRVPA